MDKIPFLRPFLRFLSPGTRNGHPPPSRNGVQRVSTASLPPLHSSSKPPFPASTMSPVDHAWSVSARRAAPSDPKNKHRCCTRNGRRQKQRQTTRQHGKPGPSSSSSSSGGVLGQVRWTRNERSLAHLPPTVAHPSRSSHGCS